MSYLKHAEHVSKGGGYTGLIVYTSNEQGSVQLTICTTCSHIDALCEHEQNTWNKEQTELRCNLCGVDAT